MATWNTGARKNINLVRPILFLSDLHILGINGDFYKAWLGHLYIKTILDFEIQFFLADFPMEYLNGQWFIFLVTLCFSSVYASHSRKCCCIKKPIMTFTSWHYSGQKDLVLLFSKTFLALLLMKLREMRLSKSSVMGLSKAVLLSCGLCEHCKRKMPSQQPWINLPCQADKQQKVGRGGE